MSGGDMLFGFDSGQDYADASRVIAFAEAGGLGLPDRDYYVKTDAKSVETRQKYLEHVQKMLELLGEPLRSGARPTRRPSWRSKPRWPRLRSPAWSSAIPTSYSTR